MYITAREQNIKQNRAIAATMVSILVNFGREATGVEPATPCGATAFDAVP